MRAVRLLAIASLIFSEPLERYCGQAVFAQVPNAVPSLPIASNSSGYGNLPSVPIQPSNLTLPIYTTSTPTFDLPNHASLPVNQWQVAQPVGYTNNSPAYIQPATLPAYATEALPNSSPMNSNSTPSPSSWPAIANLPSQVAANPLPPAYLPPAMQSGQVGSQMQSGSFPIASPGDALPVANSTYVESPGSMPAGSWSTFDVGQPNANQSNAAQPNAMVQVMPVFGALPPGGYSAIDAGPGFGPSLGGDVAPPVLRDGAEIDWRLPPRDNGIDLHSPILHLTPDAPHGFTGPSGVLPREQQTTGQFQPVEDRWRIGLPDYDRYGKGHPPQDDYLGVEGTRWDPYNQNVLKGDYPIWGQHTFLRLTARNFDLFEGRQLPTPTTPFEATRDPFNSGFFGDPDSYLFVQNTSLSFDIFHGNTAFKPADWRVKVESVFNLNHLVADELAVVNPDVRAGQSRFREDFTLQEWFGEVKLLDTSPYYDFLSTRVGSQTFTSDFRGFIFSDTNRAVRLFGTRLANRDQYNVIWFDQMEKDTNSLLNRLEKDRHQNTLIANYYRNDFWFPGYNVSASFHANRDKASTEFDRNNFLVRPDPVGVFAPHEVRSYYMGLASNGHVERVNVSSALYYVFGTDDLNPIAGQRQSISAGMGALELSYDRDWLRFRTSYFYSSGDADPNNKHAAGFDGIFANPNFAGTEFSYWGRQGIRLFGVELTNRLSLTPSLRQSKFQGQTNFVNPGLHLANFGMDADVTPKLRFIQNTNLLWFDQTEVLETYLFTGNVRNFIGTDVSLGAEYRPLLNNNILFQGGIAKLFGGDAFDDLFQGLSGSAIDHMAAFIETTFEY